MAKTLKTIVSSLIVLICLTSFLSACSSNKKAAPSSPFRREPIKEVSEDALAADAAIIDALALQQSGRTEEALQSFSDVAKKWPQCGAAWYQMSRLLLQRGWTDSASACINRAVALADTNRWYLLQQADIRRALGDEKGLVRTWERIVELWPEKLEYSYELSNANIDAGNIEAAVEALNRVEKTIGITEPISLQKQRLWTAAGKPEKAEREVEALAEAMPQEKRYQAILAEINMGRKKYSKAKKYYDRVLAADPDDEYIHIQLAEYYKTIGKPAEADRELSLAFDNPKIDCHTKVQLLGSFYSAEEFYTSRSGAAFALFEKAIARCDDSTAFALVYADVLMRQKRYAEASKWFEISLSTDSSDYAVWEALLICFTEIPQREADMLRYAQRAERLFPVHTLPYFIQALSAIGQEDYPTAISKLRKAEQWGFTNGYLEADCYSLMAEALYRTADYPGAWKYFERTLSIRPTDWGTMNNYAYYLSEQNTDLPKAERLSKQTIDAEPNNANILDTYAWILHLMGRDAEALPYQERALRLDPSNETFLRHLKAIRGE